MNIIIPFPKSNAVRDFGPLPEPVHTHVTLPNPNEFFASQRAEQGRRAWDALHSYWGDDPKIFVQEVFEPMIPSGGCNCPDGYKNILKTFQWDFTSPERFFESGVDLHNLVNQKLIAEGDTTKRIVSLEEAYATWRPQ
jgi:hypothetical protein